MLNWVDKNERLPTESDANEDGYLYVIGKSGVVSSWHVSQFKSPISPTYWLPFHEMPIPKRWRVPTIHDLAKAGKPIPCRMRDDPKDCWENSSLCAMDVSIGETSFRQFFSCHGDWYYFCEICDE